MNPLKNLLILPVEMDELYTITSGVTTQKSKSATLLIRKLRKPGLKNANVNITTFQTRKDQFYLPTSNGKV